MIIDELNIIKSESEFIDIEQFFDEMDLTDKQKKDRKDLAYDVKEAVLFLFALLTQLIDSSVLTYSFILLQFKNRYREEVAKRVQIDEELENYISDISTSIVSTSFKHLEAFRNATELIESNKNNVDGNFFNSEKRAIMIAENESETVLNYDDYNKAIENGYTHKKWITMKDRRVRKTHREVDNKIVPIKDLFVVGNSLMRFPHDAEYSADAQEIINCRCTVKYLK